MNLETVFYGPMGRPLILYPKITNKVGGVHACLMVSYLESETVMSDLPAGWVRKTVPEWQMETGLSPELLYSASEILRAKGLLEEARAGDLFPDLFTSDDDTRLYRLNEDRLAELVARD